MVRAHDWCFLGVAAVLACAAGCEDNATSPPARTPEEVWQQSPPPRAGTATASDDDEEPPADRPAAAPPARDPDCPTDEWCVKDPDGKMVSHFRPESLDEKRGKVQRALEPLARNAVTDREKAAAKRAIELASAMVETVSVQDAIKAGLARYDADVTPQGN